MSLKPDICAVILLSTTKSSGAETRRVQYWRYIAKAGIGGSARIVAQTEQVGIDGPDPKDKNGQQKAAVQAAKLLAPAYQKMVQDLRDDGWQETTSDTPGTVLALTR